MQVQDPQKMLELRCLRCGKIAEFAKNMQTCFHCGYGILQAEYDLASLNRERWHEQLRDRGTNLWRYCELLPIQHPNNIISLGEGWTPLIPAPRLGAEIGLSRLYIKDERQNPTGSFKDRQAAVAISVLKEQGVTELVLASTGNVAIAYSAFAAKAGMKLWAFFPRYVPEEKIREAAVYGTEIIRIEGTYDEAKAAAADFAQRYGYFLDKGVKTFAGVESMKTLAFEVAEQLGWNAPDWYVQGVSGGMGPIGVAQGFAQLVELGLIAKVPAIAAIQSAGCAPMVRAFERGERMATPIVDSQTAIATLATGDPGEAYTLLYDLMQAHGGAMAAVTDAEAYAMTLRLARTEGLSVEPATAVAFAGLAALTQRGAIASDAMVVINCTGHTYPVEAHIVAAQLGRGG